jgi:hypothetical protein
VEQICRAADHPLLEVLPFQAKRVGVVALGETSDSARAAFDAAIERKLRWYGATLVGVRHVPADAEAAASAFHALLRDGADLLLAAGGNTIDPLDPIEQALALIDGSVAHRGAPARGSMCWIAHTGDVPIVNLASGRMWTGRTVGDLILPLLMAGVTVTPEEIADIGYGGLPGSAVNLRFPPYDEESSAPT